MVNALSAAHGAGRFAAELKKYTRPQLLLIDEPSLGLAPVVVQDVFEILTRLKAEGRTIVLVEQNTNMALRLADQVYLMQGGKVTLAARAAEVDVETLHDRYFAR